MKKTTKYILLAMTIGSVVAGATGCFGPDTSKAYTDINRYFMLNYTDDEGNEIKASTTTDGEIAAVVMEDEYSTDYAIIKGDDIYVDIHGIKKYIDDRFYWDSSENLVMFTNATTIFTSKVGESKITSDKTEDLGYTISFVDGENCYVNMEFVKNFIDVDYKLSKKEGDIPARLSIQYKDKDVTSLSVKRNTQIRTDADYMADIVCNVDKDTKISLVEKGDEWDKVISEDGYVGYILSKRVEEGKTETLKYENDDATYTHTLMDEKVSMVWHQMTYYEGNAYLNEMTADMKGVNVISPTWFAISDKNGNIDSLASKDYVTAAHQKGLKVWALINDFSTDSKGNYYIKKVVTNTKSRQNLVSNIMECVDNFDLDGINIDFEYINVAEGDGYLQFLRELSIKCREKKIVLSVDNYVPSDWTQFYDREQQGKLADYLVVMNYDEHTTSSEDAGSVASMSFVNEGLKNTIEQVGDSTRVINGMPFYTRVWCETPEESSDGTGKLIEDSANGNYYLSTQAVSMSTATETYKAAGATPVFNEETGQNFVSYELNGSTYMIWLEDKVSVEARLKLIDEYKLGGAAYWKLGMETSDIWKIVSQYLDK